ncbi:MAG: phosphotransferase family protein, partial [Erythrobacter sp.]|nr:phosphotransferase family protein [Erythrobacter sp.]
MADSFEEKLTAVLAHAIAGFETLVSCDRLSGGASQETYRIEIASRGSTRLLAMRRATGGEDDAGFSGAPGLAVEAKLFDIARKAGVPEPEIYYTFKSSDGLGAGFIMEWLAGETLGARINKIPELDRIRPKLAHECGQILARIHDIDLDHSGLRDALTETATGDLVRKMWDEYQTFDTPQPMIDFTARWLLGNLPDQCEHRLTHGDFRNGNLMVTPEGIIAVLDWELAYIGDPVRDLGWICTNSWRFGRHELPVGGFGTREDLLAGYETQCGRKIDPDHLRFWEVFGSFWWAIGCLKMQQSWRDLPERSVERPGIARRSSECQTDCANLIIPGPVNLLEPGVATTTVDMPSS